MATAASTARCQAFAPLHHHTHAARGPSRSFRPARHADRIRPDLRAVQQEEAAAASADAAVPVDPADRRFLSLIPPFFSRATELEEFSPGLWGLVQPFSLLGVDIRLRMTAARLDDGSLLLISPVAPTPELLRMLGGLGGDVSHIIVPSSSPEHWWFAPALSGAFPAASVWTAPGFLEGKGLPIPFFQQLISSMRPRCRALGVDPLPAELLGQVESELLAVTFFLELAVVLPRYKALLLSDTGFCMGAEDFAYVSAVNRAAAASLGVWDRLGPVTKQVFQAFPEEGRAWVEAVLARGTSWDTVIPGHATAPIPDGHRAFRECFDFLYP